MLPAEKEKHLEILRKIPSHKKLQSAFELYDFARQRVSSEILRQNPQISQEELKKVVNERFASK